MFLITSSVGPCDRVWNVTHIVPHELDCGCAVQLLDAYRPLIHSILIRGAELEEMMADYREDASGRSRELAPPICHAHYRGRRRRKCVEEEVRGSSNVTPYRGLSDRLTAATAASASVTASADNACFPCHWLSLARFVYAGREREREPLSVRAPMAVYASN